MRISEHWILVLGLLMMAVGLLILHRLIGPQDEPAACEVGPMEAIQCRTEGRDPAVWVRWRDRK